MINITTAEIKFMRQVTKYTCMDNKTITNRNHIEQNLKNVMSIRLNMLTECEERDV
jgi:hypothetical protein